MTMQNSTAVEGSPSTSDDAVCEPAEIRRAAMNLLSRREHSLDELRQKLQRRFDNAAMLENQLQRLADENLQSDARFAESFARQRAGRGYGPSRVRQDNAIAQAFETAELDWWALAEAAFRKKFGEPARVEMKEKAKRMRFMQYRGFSADHYQHLFDA